MCRYLPVAAILLIASAETPLVGNGVRQPCSLEILTPRAGERVSARGLVSGVATVPVSGHVWVLARHQGLAGWWPQGGGSARVVDGAWAVYVTYGVPNELGPFEIAAVVVDDQSDENLRGWVRDAPPLYPPAQFPNTIEGCPVRTLVVEKVDG